MIMAKKEVTPEEIVQNLDGAMQLFGQAQSPLLGEFAALQDRRAKRLQQVDARLVAELGEDHPRVVALRQTQKRTVELQRSLKDNETRTANLRELKTYEWMVYGEVVDRQGEPVEGVIVRVYDKDRKYDDLLGYTTTDKFGDFQVIYHERAFYEPGEEKPELFLQVEGEDGQVLYSSEETIRFQAGRIEYFRVVLETAKRNE
jgi:hypothetical protein